jgi:hypothetical protein
MPPTNLRFQTSPKSAQKEAAPLCPPNPPQGSTSPPMWSDLAPSGSSPLFVLAYLRTIKLFLLSFSFKIVFLGCVPLFSYRDSKGHHREPSCPLRVSHPFTNPCVQTNRRAPSQTRLPKRTHALVNYRAPWDQCTRPWCTPHADTPQSLGHFIFGQTP